MVPPLRTGFERRQSQSWCETPKGVGYPLRQDVQRGAIKAERAVAYDAVVSVLPSFGLSAIEGAVIDPDFHLGFQGEAPGNQLRPASRAMPAGGALETHANASSG